MDSLARSVLDAALSEWAVQPKQIVSPRTAKDIFHTNDESLARAWASMSRNLRGLRRDTFDDYHRRNKESIDAKELFGEHPNLVFCSSEELEGIFAHGGGWEQFEKTYPDSCGIMDISCPGFSSNRQQALITVGQQQHYMMGDGHHYLCAYDGAAWRVTRRHVAWRS